MSESSGLLILVVGSIPTRPTNKIEGPAEKSLGFVFSPVVAIPAQNA